MGYSGNTEAMSAKYPDAVIIKKPALPAELLAAGRGALGSEPVNTFGFDEERHCASADAASPAVLADVCIHFCGSQKLSGGVVHRKYGATIPGSQRSVGGFFPSRLGSRTLRSDLSSCFQLDSSVQRFA